MIKNSQEITKYFKIILKHVDFFLENIQFIQCVEITNKIHIVVNNVYLDFNIIFHMKDNLTEEQSSSFNLNYYNFKFSAFYLDNPFRCYLGKSIEFSNFEKHPDRVEEALTISKYYENHYNWLQSVFFTLIESIPTRPRILIDNYVSVYSYFREASDLHKKRCFEYDLLKQNLISLVKPLIALNDTILFFNTSFSDKLKLGVVTEINKSNYDPLIVKLINKDFRLSHLPHTFVDYINVHAIMDDNQLNKLKDKYKIKNSSQLISYINNSNKPKIKFKYIDFGKIITI